MGTQHALLKKLSVPHQQKLPPKLPERPQEDAHQQPSKPSALPPEKPTQHALLKKLSAARPQLLLSKMLPPNAQPLLPSAKPPVPPQLHALLPKSNVLLPSRIIR